METETPQAKPYKGHTHPSNFGRYVEGCERCEAIRLDPSLKTSHRYNKARAKTQSYLRTEMKPEDIQKAVAQALPGLTPTGTVSYDQFQEVLKELARTQSETMKDFARELKKPDPETLAKQEKEKIRFEAAKAARIAEINAEIAAKEELQNSCSHTKENGKTSTYTGQLFSDGKFHPMCHRCGKEFTPFAPAMGVLTGGVA